MQITTQITIQATPKKIWKVFTDFNKFLTWNPFIKKIVGNLKVGSTLKVQIHPPNSSAMNFTPTMLTLKENKELSWIGKFLFKGIFDGEHKFELIDNKDGTTTFIQSEIFKGILVPLFKKQLEINTKNGFMAMNKALKELVEKD